MIGYDFLRDCRKSIKVLKAANIAIWHVMKSASYRHQFPMFRVFRQTLCQPNLEISISRRHCASVDSSDECPYIIANTAGKYTAVSMLPIDAYPAPDI